MPVWQNEEAMGLYDQRETPAERAAIVNSWIRKSSLEPMLANAERKAEEREAERRQRELEGASRLQRALRCVEESELKWREADLEWRQGRRALEGVRGEESGVWPVLAPCVARPEP